MIEKVRTDDIFAIIDRKHVLNFRHRIVGCCGNRLIKSLTDTEQQQQQKTQDQKHTKGEN